MFDFGFSEILLIFVLALIVLGPERLPSVVRRVGRWVGRARAMARQLQEQLEEEIDLDGRRRTTPPQPAATAPEPVSAPSAAVTALETAAGEDAGRSETASQAEPDNTGSHEPRV